ncbi:uncharacterized protein [Malus domestica]|uniref:uncharacterized protein n=1 Tax=Malus domestica TaxID=3750 RepID=UPI003975A297
MTNISRSPFTNEIKRTDPPRGFTMPHFTSYKRDEDPDRYLKHYCSTMILYKNNDALMCKNFAITLQGEVQDWFHTLPSQSIRSFNELSFVFIKEYSSNCSIKRTSDHLFSIIKDPRETIRDYVKRFKAEKAKIVGCNKDIAMAAFRNGLPTEHLLFGKLIMGEELTLIASYAWQKSMHYGTRPSSLTKMSRKRSTWNVHRPKKTQGLKHSPSSQFQSAKFSASSRMNLGSNCRHP